MREPSVSAEACQSAPQEAPRAQEERGADVDANEEEIDI
jgi:hypothetical protein